ncbi:hypothetical protein EEL52_03925 [Muribaculaceae bacterium Isolate-113 (HZI)]|nr:hypothetical protein EEL53_03765 [Muribaculaceae bacterium Isolate-114 (HZI)]ROT24246.1 hypothetical protein EEL52_03925 [Muribaculaceae bacterium Isolate-113 (HZI)]
MAKFFTYSLLAAALGFASPAFADDAATPALTFTVDRAAVESKMVFQISATDGATIQVDWGDGVLKDVTIADYDAAGYVFTEVDGTIAGTSIKVYAPDASKINYLSADWTQADDADAKIKGINVSQLAGLKELILDNNNIGSLDISKCVALTTLRASDNRLTSLTFGENPNLKTVTVSNNFNVTSGSLNSGAGNNQVLAADWSKLPELSSLNVAANLYSELGWSDTFDISKNTKLATLNINGCGISELDLTPFTSLKTLNAQWNSLEKADLSGMVANGAFPSLTLSTTAITVGQSEVWPRMLFSFIVAPEAAGKTMTLNISTTDKQSVQVDWGNGTLSNPVETKNYETDWEYGTPTGKVAGTNVTVYGSDPTTINKLDLAWDKEAGAETKILSANLSKLSGMDDLTVASNALTSLDLTGNAALAKLYINGNNISDIRFPENCALTRIEAQNTAEAGENDLFKVDLSKATKLNYLVINFNNKNSEATTINLENNTELATLMATDCNLETIDVSKLAKLAQLTVNNNNLETVDVSQMNEKGRLFAMNNKISSLVLPAKLATLNVSNNKLTFETLPSTSIATNYTYNNQKPMVVTAAEGKVDLSSQAMVDNVETVYVWTSGTEEIKDFSVMNGLFTFTKSAEKAVCTMTNAMLPKLSLTTVPVDITVEGSAVEEIEATDNCEAEYFNLQGVKVSGNEPGIYIRRQGNKTSKVIVK